MKILKKLIYRTKRFFTGDSGIVERVDPVEVQELERKARGLGYRNFIKDYFGNIPKRVFFRNPLGELVSDLTPKTLRRIDNLGIKLDEYAPVYETYKPGDKFP